MKLLKQILMAPANLLVWTSHSPAETMLLSICAYSLLPFFMHVGSPAMFGGLFGFFAIIAEKYIFKYEKQTRLFIIISLAILATGIISFFIIGDKQYNSQWSPVDNFLSTYHGAFWGIMLSNFIISLNEDKRQERIKQREIDKKILERQNLERQILQKEKEGFIAIRKNENLLGYVEKEVYDDFIKNNIKN